MNPWIRRLAMMLGIVVPGVLLIILKVPPALILPVLALAAVAILFAARSITVADLKSLRRRAGREPVAKAAGGGKAGSASPVPASAGILSQLRQVPGALRDLGGLLGGRRQVPSLEESRMDAIDRALDRSISLSRGRSAAPVTVRRPVSRGKDGEEGGSGGDPFLDLLDGNLDPGLLDGETPRGTGTGPDLPLDRGIGLTPLIHASAAGKEKQPMAGRATAAAGGKGAPAPEIPGDDIMDIQLERIDGIPRTIPSMGKTGGATASPPAGASAPLQTVPGTPEARPGIAVKEVKPPAKVGDHEMISFTDEPGGSMDDLMAALKADAVHVRKRDDNSLLRDMKGVTVRGKELVDELTALLKKLRK
jgi:hypothetical protein